MSGVLLLRRDGRLWGIEDRAVERVTAVAADAAMTADVPVGGRFAVTTAGGELVADEVLGVVETLEVRPAGGVFTHLWGRSARGLAVHGTAPLVVIDPESPPAELLPAHQESREEQ